MKVAFLTTPQARYADYWLAFLGALQIDVVQPLAPYDAWLPAGRASLPDEPLLVQLALGEILSLDVPSVDLVLVPEQPAVRDDPWTQAFADLLPKRIAGLPPLVAVPDEPQALRAVAVQLGQRLVGNANMVHRALEQVEKLGQAERREKWPNLQEGQQPSVGVVAPRALLAHPDLGDGLLTAVRQAGLYPVPAHRLPATQVWERGQRLEDAKATAGERLLYGAAQLLEGKGAIQGLILAAPARDVATQAVLGRLASALHKPTQLLVVEAGQTEWPQLAEFAQQLHQ